ncbi:2'-5' RNA ligase family protein [Anaerobacillus sp. 1_MG-2023]|uniref:2'-5' RNA ligase family protein n=1 Tax=Anaerobacillus sp. 1_MG-2023 TaxID=3062655 RepID=UPI0026E1E967|nr:2'-5' RNA ligase family protein [Anaerobacillus sp. 1_MG-2023]MDO6654592.1 2'-5' RNA ligase family protein [Anaerobacillus sp. 1_MG-2023]
MPNQYFIGITPPPDYLAKVEHFQRKWINFLGVEPHITLKAQGGLSPDKKWIEKVENVCKKIHPFTLTVAEPHYFGDNILYLSVTCDQLFPLHEAIVKAISPPEELIKHYFELDDYVGHLTLGKEQYGISKSDLKDIELLAKQELTPYPTFKVESIRIYELKPSNKRYEPYLDLPLGANL